MDADLDDHTCTRRARKIDENLPITVGNIDGFLNARLNMNT